MRAHSTGHEREGKQGSQGISLGWGVFFFFWLFLRTIMNFLCRANLALPVTMTKARPIFHRQSRGSFSIAHSLIDQVRQQRQGSSRLDFTCCRRGVDFVTKPSLGFFPSSTCLFVDLGGWGTVWMIAFSDWERWN